MRSILYRYYTILKPDKSLKGKKPPDQPPSKHKCKNYKLNFRPKKIQKEKTTGPIPVEHRCNKPSIKY